MATKSRQSDLVSDSTAALEAGNDLLNFADVAQVPDEADLLDAAEGTASDGSDIGLIGDPSVMMATVSMGMTASFGEAISGCGCPMCADDRTGRDPSDIGASDGGDGAPGPAGSLQTLADYLRVGYWTDTGRNSRWYNVTNSGVGANNGVILYNVSGNGFDSNGISAARQTMAREAFAIYEAVLGIDFVETTATDTSVDIFFTDNDSGAYNSSTLNSILGISLPFIDYSRINVAASWSGSSSNIGGTNGYTFQTFMHEIGHALGLGHQGNYNAGVGTPSYANSAIWANDSWTQTMMSYWDQSENTWSSTDSWAQLVSPMAVDWIALNQLYDGQGFGINNAFTGDTTWGVGTNISAATSAALNGLADFADTNAFTIVDGGGFDTVDFSNYNVNQMINLGLSSASSTQATISSVGGLTGNMTIAVGTVIENAYSGGGNDQLYGNDVNNLLKGGGGDDSLYGGEGDDTLSGEAGNDFMKGGGGADSLLGGSGIDTVNYSDSTEGISIDLAEGTGSGGTAEGDTFSGVENIDGTGYGDILMGDDNANVLNGLGDVDWLFGEGGADALNGGTGDDLLKGGGGADALNGGDGIDMASYSDSAAGVTVNLATGTGTGGDAEGDTLANIESLTGSDLNDTLTGNTGANTINGGLGDDTLSGGGGIDTLSGGDGNDTLIESNPNTPGDVFNGGAGIDTLLATQTWTTGVLFDLVAGTMTYLGTVYDTLSGIENLTLGGNANVTGDANANVITMTSAFGNNTVNSGGGDDTVYAGGGNDTVRGGTGTDAVYGEAGDDLIIIAGGDGLDNAYGGDGIDTLDYTGTAGDIVFNMITGAFDYNSNLRDAQGFENFTGSNGADTVFGTAGANTILGNSGDDTIRGGAGADVLDGGAGSNDMLSYTGSNAGVAVDLSTNIANGGHATGDTISGFESINGSSFGDTLIGDAGVNRIYGNEGNDIVRGGAGGDILGGGAGGADLLSYEGSDAGVTVDLGNNTANGGHATGDVIATFERVLGTIFNDVLLGSGGSNQLRGDLGDDTLRGGAGADQLFGGTGGSDTVSYAGSNAGVTVDIGANTANGGHATGDLISGFENIFGSGFNDTLTGSVDANVLNGGAGDDTILGMGGDDTIDGGANADRIDGGGGHDTLTGGFGSDTFVLGYYASGSDIITDFNVAADQLEISAADFGGGLVAGVLPAGQFLANNTGLAGDANDRFILNTLTGDLFFDVNGTGAGGSRLIATFTGVIPVLTSADFTIV